MARTLSRMLALGTPAPDFELPTTDGSVVRLSDFAGKPLLVMFICNHCPFVRHLQAGLAAFARQYQERGLAVVAISSNDVATHPQDGPVQMAEEAQRAGYTFPYLYDESQDVALAYQAACTPDFFLFDEAHRLVYRGQFDDSRPGNNIPVTGADLRGAADALLAGVVVSADQKPSLGCNIKWRAGREPAWT